MSHYENQSKDRQTHKLLWLRASVAVFERKKYKFSRTSRYLNNKIDNFGLCENRLIHQN